MTCLFKFQGTHQMESGKLFFRLPCPMATIGNFVMHAQNSRCNDASMLRRREPRKLRFSRQRLCVDTRSAYRRPASSYTSMKSNSEAFFEWGLSFCQSNQAISLFSVLSHFYFEFGLVKHYLRREQRRLRGQAVPAGMRVLENLREIRS